MEDYSWIKKDEDYFRLLTLCENKSINYLLTSRKIIRYDIEKSIRNRDFEKLAKFWKEEHLINYFLKKNGYQEKKEANSLIEKIIEGKSELIDNFIRTAKEILLREKK